MTSRKRKVSAVKAEATRLHSQLVRSRGYCECCGDEWRASGSKLECAHIVSRRFSSTRTDLANAFCLCSRCHMRFTEWPMEFASFVESKIGEDGYTALRAKATSGAKLDWYERLDELRAIAEEIGLDT